MNGSGCMAGKACTGWHPLEDAGVDRGHDEVVYYPVGNASFLQKERLLTASETLATWIEEAKIDWMLPRGLVLPLRRATFASEAPFLVLWLQPKDWTWFFGVPFSLALP